MAILDYANPTRFLALAARLLPWLQGLTVLTLVVGLAGAFTAPADSSRARRRGSCTFMCPRPGWRCSPYGVMTSAALGVCWCGNIPSPTPRKRPRRRWERPSPFLCLVTGVAVGQADVGDVLGVGRAAHLDAGAVPALSRPHRRAPDHGRHAARRPHASIMTLVGVIDIPIIKYSVRMVEHVAPARLGVSRRRAGHFRLHAVGRCW